MINRIDSGELSASTSMRHRIEGALAATNAILGRSTDELLELLQPLDRSSKAIDQAKTDLP